MRLSEMEGKDIVNIYDGRRMGSVAESDLIVDEFNGEIVSLIMPNRGNFINLWVDRQRLTIPWEAVKKIGREVIVIDVDSTHPRLKKSSI
ncbi:MAG: YlmC/YmxH family sporulation protein [Methylocystaceae bacterium]